MKTHKHISTEGWRAGLVFQPRELSTSQSTSSLNSSRVKYEITAKEVLQRPGQSPDLNLIERLWSDLEGPLHKRMPSYLSELNQCSSTMI